MSGSGYNNCDYSQHKNSGMSASGFYRTATVDDLYKIDSKAELVDGQLVRMPPTGGMPSQASTAILLSLYSHVRAAGKGIAVGDNCGFVVNLPHRQSFSPDAALWTGAKPTMKFYQGAPVFAVECAARVTMVIMQKVKWRPRGQTTSLLVVV